MSTSRVLLILGIIIALVPFIGLPYSYLMWAYPCLGLLVIICAAALVRSASRVARPVSHDPETHP